MLPGCTTRRWQSRTSQPRMGGRGVGEVRYMRYPRGHVGFREISWAWIHPHISLFACCSVELKCPIPSVFLKTLGVQDCYPPWLGAKAKAVVMPLSLTVSAQLSVLPRLVERVRRLDTWLSSSCVSRNASPGAPMQFGVDTYFLRPGRMPCEGPSPRWAACLFPNLEVVYLRHETPSISACFLQRA
jgi:hypothetical protein